MDFVPGALVGGRYRLRRMVGAGGMGEVWAGEDQTSGTRVAVKHLLPAAAKHHEVVARFKREAFLLGRVESDYVARVIDFFDDETYGLVLAMEFIEGPSLAHILEGRSLTVEEAIELGVDLLHALKDLHASSIVHRDLKPGNIIMRPMAGGGTRATVVDFGISRLLPGKDENEVTGITRANIALGTVEYMAPEQILNSRDVTPVTDLYAVGIILFRAVKGHHAFGDRRGEELARAKLIEEAPGLEVGRGDGLAKGLAAVIARALKKKPSHRYASAEQMLDEVMALKMESLSSLDLDDSTTDGDTADTAVKPSPLASSRGDAGGHVAELPPVSRGSGPPIGPPVSGVPKVEIKQDRAPPAPPASRPGAAMRGSMPSLPEVHAPLPRTSQIDPHEWSPADRPAPEPPKESGPRASFPSIPDGLGRPESGRPSGPGDPGLVRARASLPSISERASLDGSAPPSALPPPSELTTERGPGMSRGTIALAILTAFAVGAAVGLIVAPTNAPATKAAETCAPCASAAATSNATAPTSAAATPTSVAGAASSGSAHVATSGSGPAGSASAKASASVKASASASKSSDGLGEEDPPRPKPKPAPPPAAPSHAPTPTLFLPPPPAPPPPAFPDTP